MVNPPPYPPARRSLIDNSGWVDSLDAELLAESSINKESNLQKIVQARASKFSMIDLSKGSDFKGT